MSYITAIGTAVPPISTSQLDSAEMICDAMNLNSKQRKTLKWIYSKTAIKKRHSVLDGVSNGIIKNKYLTITSQTSTRMELYESHAKSLALKAIEDLPNLTMLSDVTDLITVSCTGMYAPGLGIDIIHELKLNHSIKRTAINFMGCYAAFPALRMADNICKANKNAKVLIIAVELCSLHIQNEFNTDNLLASAIFSDGSAAVIIESETTKSDAIRLCNFYSHLIPDHDQNMAWNIRNHGFDIRLSSYLPKLLSKGISKLLVGIYEYYQIKKDNINWYAIHPGGKSILEAVENCLSISSDKNYAAHHVLENYGNMSSVTILFVIKQLIETIKRTQPQTILAMAFGPGLTLETMLLETS